MTTPRTLSSSLWRIAQLESALNEALDLLGSFAESDVWRGGDGRDLDRLRAVLEESDIVTNPNDGWPISYRRCQLPEGHDIEDAHPLMDGYSEPTV